MSNSLITPEINPTGSPALTFFNKKKRRTTAVHGRRKQAGMTLISTIIIIVFLLFQGVVAMNVIPVYLTYSSIKTIMAGLPTDDKARGANKSELKLLIAKRLRMNNVYTVKSDKVSIKKGRGEYIVTIEYEPRGKLIGNLDFIVSFKHEARVPTR